MLTRLFLLDRCPGLATAVGIHGELAGDGGQGGGQAGRGGGPLRIDQPLDQDAADQRLVQGADLAGLLLVGGVDAYSACAQNARASSIPSATAARTSGSRWATVKMSKVASHT
jgi:hypothetical protein